MNKLNISGRDIRIFFFGMFIMFLILLIFDWKEVKRGFSDGYNNVRKYEVK